MVKRSYEFVDIALLKQREKELLEREEKETTRIFKVCLKCGVRKSLLHFAIDKRSSDNRTGECKLCRSKRALQYYYNNRERLLLQIKEYQDTRDRSEYFENYQRNNKERLKKIAKAWYKKNRKKIKKRNLRYYEENKEACQAMRKKWIEGHKERIKEYNREYNLKMKGG